MLEMEPTPRRTWKLGLVLLTYPGADGLVRKARIKTATSVYDRPIHKLCLIATKEELSNETTNVVINAYRCSILSHNNVIQFPHWIGSVLHEIIQAPQCNYVTSLGACLYKSEHAFRNTRRSLFRF